MYCVQAYDKYGNNLFRRHALTTEAITPRLPVGRCVPGYLLACTHLDANVQHTLERPCDVQSLLWSRQLRWSRGAADKG
jgi:hypothetical protein